MKLTLRTTLLLLVSVPALVITAGGGYYAMNRWNHSVNLQKAEDLVILVEEIANYTHESQIERGRTAAFLASEAEKTPQALIDQRKKASAASEALVHHLDRLDFANLTEVARNNLIEARNIIDSIEAHRAAVDARSIPLPQAIGTYTRMHAHLLDAVASATAGTGDAYLLKHSEAIAMLAKAKERAGIERAVLASAFTRGEFVGGEYAKFIRLVTQQTTFSDEFKLLAKTEQVEAFNELAASKSAVAVREFREIAMANPTTALDANAEMWFSAATNRINAVREFEHSIILDLEHAAHDKMVTARNTAFAFIGGITVVTVGLLFAGISIARSIAKQIKGIAGRVSRAAAEGDLTVRFRERGNDEFAALGAAFNEMFGRFQELVKQVSDASHEVAGAATQIAATAHQLSGGMDHQTNETNRAAAGVEQLSVTIGTVNTRSEEAQKAADESRENATSGGDIVRETVTEIQAIATEVRDSANAINQLGSSVEQIGQVIAVINDIADQTNLLALNAAIEAARAGEHGRGFAVVADEVRKLAERTTHATAEVADSIKGIQSETRSGVERIESSVHRVDHGVELAEQAGHSLDRIVGAADHLREMVGAISTAAAEQAQASGEIAETVDSVARVTRETNEAAGQAAQASEALSARSEQLRNLVQQFVV